MTIQLSTDQEEAIKLLKEEIESGNPFVTLGGYAGSGKSTLIPILSEQLGDTERTAFVCYTGKASQVLRDKLRVAGMLEDAAYVGTIHGLIYELVKEDDKGQMEWRKKSRLVVSKDIDAVSIERIIIDEVSMVGKEMLADLFSFGIPILAVGDPAQLPPVNDESVLLDPDVLLTSIHRQAKDNPIIQIATHIREHGTLPSYVKRTQYDEAGDIVESMLKSDPLNFAILARSNKARCWFNTRMCGEVPAPGHPVICLKNDWRKGIYNGLRGVIQTTDIWVNRNTPWLPMRISCDDGRARYLEDVCMPQFGREKPITKKEMSDEFNVVTIGSLFDFGAAMTVHKAQGSGFHTTLVSPETWEWNKNERVDMQKWLYTAVTRATTVLHVLPDW